MARRFVGVTNNQRSANGTIASVCCDAQIRSLLKGGLNRSTQHFILKERWSVL